MMTMVHEYSDKRMIGGKRAMTGAETDGSVFAIMQNMATSATIADVHRKLPELSERTIRRSIARLQKSGHVIPSGRDAGAVQYTVKTAVVTPKTRNLIPFAGEMFNVEDFLTFMVNPDVDPFKPKVKLGIYDADFIHWLRRRLMIPVMTAGDSGYDAQLKQTRESLIKVQIELQKLATNLDAFINSPIWFDHYRDNIAFERREVEKSSPELVQFVMDYLQNRD